MKYLLIIILFLSFNVRASKRKQCPYNFFYTAQGIMQGNICDSDPRIECTVRDKSISRNSVKLNADGTVKCPAEIDADREAVETARVAGINKLAKMNRKKKGADELQIAIIQLNEDKEKDQRKIIATRLYPIMKYLQMRQYDLAKEEIEKLKKDGSITGYISQDEINLALSKVNEIIATE